MMIDVKGGGRLTPHFKLREFVHRHPDGSGEIYFTCTFFDFVQMLEEFRVWYNRPINITSGYRPPEYNVSVGGSPNSSHLKSLAVDFPLPAAFAGYSLPRKREFLQNVQDKWKSICRARGFGCQCNWYDTYLHLGIGERDSFIDKRSWK